MAQSRLEKVGTIYSRVTSLLKAGGMKEENQPFWLKLYEAFPPKYEPSYDRPIEQKTIRQIFYEEDKIRARFHKDYKHLSMVDLLNDKAISRSEQFIKVYKSLENDGVPEDEIYSKAVEKFMAQYATEKHENELKATERTLQQGRRQRRSTQEISASKRDTDIQELHEQDPEDMKKYKPIRFNLQDVLKVEQDENIKQSK